ncbi:MAG: hypothetical protein D6721_05655, partial [Gammaproteobacteria bacterium]
LEGLDPTHIGAITFTNAATEELRGRLRERLRQAFRALREERPLAEPWWLLVDSACRHAGHEAVLERLRNALVLMDEAPVSTIHGFCLRLLSLHPGAVETEPALDPEADDRLLDAARDFWRRHVLGNREASEAMAKLKIMAPEDLKSRLSGSIARAPLPWPDAPGNPPDLATLRERLEVLRPRLEEAVAKEWQALIGGLRERSTSLKKNSYGEDKGWWEKAAEALAKWEAGQAPFPAAVSRSRLENAVLKAARDDFLPWLEAFSLPRLADAWNEAATEFDRALEVRGHALLVEALQALPEMAAGLRSQAASLSPDDLLRLTFEALEGDNGQPLARRIAAELPLLLVDEFQDTDHLQYGILRRLRDAGTRLVLIGDPKQAIYGFRGADVHTYLAAREETPPASRFLLTHNHRSRPAVCQAVNRLFAGNYPFAWEGLDHPPAVAARDAIDYPALVLPRSLDPDPDAGLTLHPLDLVERDKVPSKDEAGRLAAASAARHIAALLEAGRKGEARIGTEPVQARDLAVLVRGHAQAEAMRKELARYRIASAYTSQESVFGTEAARGLLAWVEALAEPGSPARLRRALADSLTGLDLDSLRRALREEWEDWLDRVAGLHDLWRRRGVLSAVLRLLEDPVFADLPRREEGERLLTDLLHLAELLQAEALRHPEPAALARWFRAQVESPPKGEENVLRLESEADAVRILTIHKAKGLQFPIVYLPFLWAMLPASREAKSFLFHDGRTWRLTFDTKDAQARALAERERLSEELRLLYVALTRAETKLFGWIGPVGKEAGKAAFDWCLYPERREAVVRGAACFQAGDFGPKAFIATAHAWRERVCTLRGDAIAVATDWPQPQAAPAPATRGLALSAAPLPKRVDDPWRITSYSGILRGEHRAADYDAEEEALPAAWSGIGREYFPPGAATGNFLHRLLEETDYTDPQWESRRGHIEQLRLRYGLPAPEGWWSRLVEWMGDVLTAPLPEGGRLADLAFPDRLHETLFHFRVRGTAETALNALLCEHGMEPLEQWVPGGRLEGLLTGAVDLVYRRAGRYYIADFKSNLLPDYGPARLRQAMRERRYDLQYLLYTLALHRHLRLRLPGYDYDTHFGGVRYLFLRGMTPRHPGQGVFVTRPPRALVEGLDALLEAGA